ncbi:MAG: NAD(P)-dependent alcohol dehydrogenase [Micrococcus sp.]|nr:NAD(P)-dependent alcohol dehydrogenase [Micrococcus sp.]
MNPPETGIRPAIPTTMTSVLRREYGGVDRIRLSSVPVPVPGEREVLVAVRAAGIDRGTVHVLTGLPWLYRLVGGLQRPRRPVLGLDVSGVVVAVGAGATRFRVGDPVFGYAPGALAEYAAAPEAKLAPLPPGLSFRAAAVLPVSGTTALQALEKGRAAAGDRVLVTGASGGVGSYAVQLAAGMGCQVAAVCSGAKADFVHGLGARDVLDYRTEDPWDGSRTYDLVIDIAGRPSVNQLRRALAPTGRVVMVGGEGGGDFSGGMGRSLRAVARSAAGRQRFTMMLAEEGRADLERLAGLVVDGGLVAPIGLEVPLEEAVRAIGELEAGRVTGKAVVVVGDTPEPREHAG